MPTILIATESGCRSMSKSGNAAVELTGRRVGPLTCEPDEGCLAIVDEREVWRRSPDGAWSCIAVADVSLQSITSFGDDIFCGAREEAAVVHVPRHGKPERLKSFENVSGREEWFAGGPPLGVRSLTGTSDLRTLLAAVHVGGIPRSEDGGATWTPTIPVNYDVHQVKAHPTLPNIVVAAAAVGLCVSENGGRTWRVLAGGLPVPYSLAVGVLVDEALFSIQEGPFARRSQVWRWSLGGDALEQVREGLPEWLEGRVDTCQIAVGFGQAALADCGGNLWLSAAGSRGWKRVATDLPYVSGLAIVR